MANTILEYVGKKLMPPTEYETMRDAFLQAKYGSYLIIPLKYEENELRLRTPESGLEKFPLHTLDLNENVKAMMNENDSATVGSCYKISAQKMKEQFCAGLPEDTVLYASNEQDYPFEIRDSYLYVFHTQTAFLCMGISYKDMNALLNILNPGYAENRTGYYALTPQGEKAEVDMSACLLAFYKKLGLKPFFSAESPWYLDIYTYNVALIPRRFENLETIRQASFNLHAMMPLENAIEDGSEQDLRYVYAKKDQELMRYRWGCCVTSQTVSYIVADENMDFEAEMAAQAADGLPIIALGLYEKYTCLRFTELLTKVDKKQPVRIRRLKDLMLEFQAYGTIAPANISRWHNVKNIYKYYLEVNEIPEAIEDIDRKLNILSEHQKQISEERNSRLAGILTAFGVVSILASVLSIIQILAGGSALEWLSTAFTCLAIALVCFLVLQQKK